MDSGQRFTGKVAIVTGAASGIGYATAIRLAAEGAAVYGADIVQPQADNAGGIQWRDLDVADERGWKSLVEEILQAHTRIDVLVNNAGLVGSYDSITDIDLADWHRIIGVNQTGVFLGMRTVAPSMLHQGRGAIVNVSSIWGLVGAPGVAAYQASKGAVTLMTKNASATWATQGIRVNSVHPGLITTPLTDSQDQAISAELVAKTPMGRAGRADEVADAIAYLASDGASYITGAQLVVDGGFTNV
ncbi:SDR family NAD(P)-dependent oxidoreductase [uncultured Kocuria sp.]|uniref:SDR family NAD(P)-dependent oxidoreductase n=1 Tax=uncultured Kocuria sp. TaxID=259305 RepID=UPI0026238960|nr:glucose 1-dehydrogenase [uncultured Kocuria sp.]